MGTITVRQIQDPSLKSSWMVNVPRSIAGRRIRMFFEFEATAHKWAADKAEAAKKEGHSAFLDVHAVAGMTLDDVLKQYRSRRGRDEAKQDRTEKGCLEALAKQFGKMVMDAIPATSLEKWIWSRGESETTRAKYFRYARALWNWAIKKRLIKENVIARVDAPSPNAAAFILTPQQMKALLALDSPDWLRDYFILGGFAGIRTEEALELRWNDVHLKVKQIHVPPEVAKKTGGFDQRFVDFTSPLTAFSALWKNQIRNAGKELIAKIPYGTFRKARVAAAEAIGLPGWPRNCLRHSFASYHLAECGNAASTAYQMGHTSPAMVFKTYARAVGARDTNLWWSIRPMGLKPA